MIRQKILVLGNGPQVSDIEFDRLDSSIITLGVNRIWIKHFPNYFFFHDLDILDELNSDVITRSKLISNSKCISSDWFDRHDVDSPNWITKYPRLDRRAFPDSVTTSIRILTSKILKKSPSQLEFYIAGVNLKWTNPSHFWKDSDFDSINKNGQSWYDPRFQKILHNFKKLQSLGFNLISVTPESLLNKTMRNINISNLYRNS